MTISSVQGFHGIDQALLAIDAGLGEERSTDQHIAENDLVVKKNERADHHAKLMDALKREREAVGDGGDGLIGSIGHAVSDAASDLGHARVADAGSDLADHAQAAWSSPKLWHDLEGGAGSVTVVGSAVSAPNFVTQTAAIAGGGAHARNAGFEHDANDARADATQARHAIDRSHRDTTDTIDEMKQSKAGYDRREDLVESAMRAHDETTAAAMRVRA